MDENSRVSDDGPVVKFLRTEGLRTQSRDPVVPIERNTLQVDLALTRLRLIGPIHVPEEYDTGNVRAIRQGQWATRMPLSWGEEHGGSNAAHPREVSRLRFRFISRRLYSIQHMLSSILFTLSTKWNVARYHPSSAPTTKPGAKSVI